MAIEKSLFAAPLGESVDMVEAIEIEIEPEIVSLEDGSVEIVQGITLSDFAKEKIKVSTDELLEERAAVEDLLQ